ncbi:MAG TPA: cytochrome c biogenesis protein CcdA [Spirochaetota bacterium]|nr:cytochrome c biogenesis protein CcdA [Spirochaetota bacterium]HPU89257.1 cytochrome c biogenesis protein CcdA [Spirochaetota bacterium]
MVRLKTIAALGAAVLVLAGCGAHEYAEYAAFPVGREARVAPGGEGYLAVRIGIPADSYVYANPKGPGTGRAAHAEAKTAPGVLPGPARYLPGAPYTPQGEKEHVLIYRRETTVFVPFTVRPDAAVGERTLSVHLETLVCTANTCAPKFSVIDFIVRIDAAGPPRVHVDPALAALYRAASAPDGAIQRDPARDAERERIEIPRLVPRYTQSGSVAGIVQAIVFGLIAGFILNFMPCVLPVVSLKVLSLVRLAGERRARLVAHGLHFAMGILVVFTGLALAAAFLGAGWGALFQNQWFLVGMTAIVFALGLSLFHVFVITPPAFTERPGAASDASLMSSFGKGMLATLLATPCSGPFLGGVLAWSLAQPPGVIFVVFVSVGAGMALPYVALTAFPGLLRFVPKPGEWTIVFEQAMGFLLMATVVYLLGILEKDLLVPTLLFLLFLSAGLWQYGRWGAVHQPIARRIISVTLLVVIATGGAVLSYRVLFDRDASPMTGAARTFTLRELYASRDAGRVSLVKFTADWCPNCKLVEKIALADASVARAIAAGGVDVYTADITVKNPEAEALLAALGSRSIPFLAVFPPGPAFAEPVCLRDMYSKGDVLEALELARPANAVPEMINIDILK